MEEWWDWPDHIGWMWLEWIVLLLVVALIVHLVVRIIRRSSKR